MMNRQSYPSRMRSAPPPLKKNKKGINRRIPFVVITLLLGLAVALYFGGSFWWPKHEAVASAPVKIVDEGDFRQIVRDELFKLGLKEEWITQKRSMAEQGKLELVNVRMPMDVPLVLANLRLHQLMTAVGGTIQSVEENLNHDQLTVCLGYQQGTSHKILLKQDRGLKRGIIKIALVFDNVGTADAVTLQELFAFHKKMTLALVPGTKYCKTLAQEAQAKGCECAMELPLKTKEQVLNEPDKYALLPSFSDDQVRKSLAVALEQVPLAMGVCRLTGTTAIDDRQLAAKIMKAVKAKSFYYLDPDTCAKSYTLTLAQSLGIRAGQVRVIIDGKKDQPEIKEQLERLTKQAVETGQAVALSHLTKEAITAIKGYLPQLEERGIQLVYASELME
jgi:uncharacterized protein